ncbi:hypothetical protein Hamer_G008261 [Homarus americanus]|uniref:Uncharacterized protein n=1 Tax=Homarus americanus TaxID=6706 RepID=A0A8J5TV11_HOMAM|nr:hypothetical protein Hamer_G008261 [Homarus americanus]
MDQPLSVENLKMILLDLYEKKFSRCLPESFLSSLNTLICDAERSEQAAKILQTTSKRMKEDKKVRIVSGDVPAGILPLGITATLQDIRVSGYGPDDEIYSKNPEVRKMIPRGATLLDMKGRLSCFDVVIYANKKFTGGIGDEDDEEVENNELWKQYFLEDPDTVSKVICMTKLNGEAAHFSGRYIDGQFYLIAGSKNVHLLFRERGNIDLYEGERYAVVARTVLDTLESIDVQRRHLMYSLLHHSKCTAVCELLQPSNQHIVNLNHLEKPQLNIISLTSVYREQETSLIALPPHHTLDVLDALGFSCPAHSKISAEELEQHQNKTLGETFLKWMNNEIQENREEASNIRPRFPVMWQRFLKDTRQTDKIIP